MATVYPFGIDDNTTLPAAIDLITPVRGIVANRLRDAIIAIEQELGIDPSREFGTVRARLDALTALIGGDGYGGGIHTVKQDSVTVVSPVKSLNFLGSFIVTDNGDDEANIELAVCNNDIVQEVIPVAPGDENTYTLSQTPEDSASVQMFLNGLKLQYGVDYVVGGSTVNHIGTTVILTTDVVEFYYSVSGNLSYQETQPVLVSGQTAFTLNTLPYSDSIVQMFINGAKQAIGLNYTVSGTQVTYVGSLNLETTDVVEFWYLSSETTCGTGGGGGFQNLSDVLTIGNSTGVNNIFISNGAAITGFNNQVSMPVRITNVINPIDPQDVVTLDYLNTSFNGTLFEEIEGEDDTANDTPLVIATYELAVNNSVMNIMVMVVARDLSNNDSAFWTINAGFERTVGVVSQIGSTAILNAEKDNMDFDVDFSISGNNVEVFVIGDTANTVEWKVTAQIVRL